MGKTGEGQHVLTLMPSSDKRMSVLDLSSISSPRFIVTVDTEEEFDWNAPFTRDQHGTAHIHAIARFQALCEQNNVTPIYLIDYPIANDPKAVEQLGQYFSDGKAEIGAQLHPWVNPPFHEELSAHNSFACNLPSLLEREKLTTLVQKIVAQFGIQPVAYRAGRYGAGQNTLEILADLGIAIDMSVRARFNYAEQGGPDYSAYPVSPYWLIEGSLLELPLTTVFGGRLRDMGDSIFQRMFASEPSRSILSRTGLLERIALSPEGIPLETALKGIDAALQDQVGILNFSFHSPSLEAGHTSYTKSNEDIETFYDWWNGVFEHLRQRGVQAISCSEIKHKVIG
jgi:hypothetical protein